MYELKILVNDTLSSSSCSKLVIKIIKHILYNSQQIPLNYELLSRFMTREKKQSDSSASETKTVAVSSYKKMLVEQFYTKVLCVYNNFEDTFKNLELEFLENGGLKEIIIMIGSTMFMPKKVFRIEIPTLQDCNCIDGNSLQRNLTCVFKDMINSEHLDTYLRDNIDPMNVYILIKRITVEQTKSDWFLPKDNFRIPNVKQLVIKLTQPANIDCICPIPKPLEENYDKSSLSDSECENIADDYICWYQTKPSLKGFKDYKVDGISAFNLFNV